MAKEFVVHFFSGAPVHHSMAGHEAQIYSLPELEECVRPLLTAADYNRVMEMNPGATVKIEDTIAHYFCGRLIQNEAEDFHGYLIIHRIN